MALINLLDDGTQSTQLVSMTDTVTGNTEL